MAPASTICDTPWQSTIFGRGSFAGGEDVAALLPVLQTYLGHASISDTDYYLRLTAQSYPHITTCIQRAYGDVVPPVTEGPCDGN